MIQMINRHYIESFKDLVNSTCQENIFSKSAELSKKTKRRIGDALIASGIATPFVFSARGKRIARKFQELALKDAVKNLKALDRTVASHIRKTKAKLPKYKWEDLSEELLRNRGKRVSSTHGPVAVLRDGSKFKLSRGPAYYPKKDLITLGQGNLLSPKALLHELGHAADPELAEYMKRPGLKFTELFTGLINPEKTRMLKAELRAWNNAKIRKGDALREAALDTYRNAVRGAGATTIGAPIAVVGGVGLHLKNKEDDGFFSKKADVYTGGTYIGGDPEAAQIFAARAQEREAKKRQAEARRQQIIASRRRYDEVINRQSTTAPIRPVPLRSGVDTRSGFAGIEQYYGPTNPYVNPTIAYPGAAPGKGQTSWYDLPSTWMQRVMNGEISPTESPDFSKMSPEALAKWDRSSREAFSRVQRRAQARSARQNRQQRQVQERSASQQTQTAEQTAYNEILKRLNAKNVNGQYDAKTIQERARRLAPLVAKNYRRNENGEWNLVDPSKKQMLSAKARGIGAATMPVQPAPLPQQIAQHPAAPAAPAAPTAPAVQPATQKPVVPVTPAVQKPVKA